MDALLKTQRINQKTYSELKNEAKKHAKWEVEKGKKNILITKLEGEPELIIRIYLKNKDLLKWQGYWCSGSFLEAYGVALSIISGDTKSIYEAMGREDESAAKEFFQDSPDYFDINKKELNRIYR